jgi:hypothetical protein
MGRDLEDIAYDMLRAVAVLIAASLLAVLIGLGAMLVFDLRPARAHDDGQWIMDQKLRNQVGEWCCGKGDCNAEAHTVGRGGYSLTATGELVPFSAAMPLSIDGRLWVCRRPNGTIRCVFDRPPGS